LVLLIQNSMDLVTYYRPKWGSTVKRKRDNTSRTATTFQTVLKSFNKDVLPLKAKELAKTQQKYSESQIKQYQAKKKGIRCYPIGRAAFDLKHVDGSVYRFIRLFQEYEEYYKAEKRILLSNRVESDIEMLLLAKEIYVYRCQTKGEEYAQYLDKTARDTLAYYESSDEECCDDDNFKSTIGSKVNENDIDGYEQTFVRRLHPATTRELLPTYRPIMKRKKYSVSRADTTFQELLASFEIDVLPLKAKELLKAQKAYHHLQMKNTTVNAKDIKKYLITHSARDLKQVCGSIYKFICLFQEHKDYHEAERKRLRLHQTEHDKEFFRLQRKVYTYQQLQKNSTTCKDNDDSDTSMYKYYASSDEEDDGVDDGKLTGTISRLILTELGVESNDMFPLSGDAAIHGDKHECSQDCIFYSACKMLGDTNKPCPGPVTHDT
jgi:hypothetical protein